MAKVIDNMFLYSFSGTVGNMTFRQRNGATIVSVKCKHRKNKSTPAQQKNEGKFREAGTYAQKAIKDPVVKAIYQAVATGGQTAYNVAFSDAFKGPAIELINISRYHGQPGDLIAVTANIFLILKMDVMIVNPDGVIVEEGPAVVSGKKWKYTARIVNEVHRGSKVIVTVVNRRGKVMQKEIAVEC